MLRTFFMQIGPLWRGSDRSMCRSLTAVFVFLRPHLIVNLAQCLFERSTLFSNRAHVCQVFPGVAPVFQGILIVQRCARSCSASMHSAALLSFHSRRTTGGSVSGLGPAARAFAHRGGVALVAHQSVRLSRLCFFEFGIFLRGI